MQITSDVFLGYINRVFTLYSADFSVKFKQKKKKANITFLYRYDHLHSFVSFVSVWLSLDICLCAGLAQALGGAPTGSSAGLLLTLACPNVHTGS